MKKWGSINIKELKQLQKSIEKLQSNIDLDEFYISLVKEIAARFLAKVIKRTPVGKYPKETGKVGGTLRRGWMNGNTGDVTTFAQNIEVKKEGTTYMVEIINPVEYASYVEYGHRTRSGTGWVEGRFMMTISEEEIQGIAPKLIEKRVNEKLREVFGGK